MYSLCCTWEPLVNDDGVATNPDIALTPNDARTARAKMIYRKVGFIFVNFSIGFVFLMSFERWEHELL